MWPCAVVLRRCERLDDRAWLCALERTQEMLNVSQAVALAKSDSLSVPLVVGWSRPVIVIPDGLTQTANAELIGLVLLHELAHVRRGDLRVESRPQAREAHLLASSSGLASRPDRRQRSRAGL